MANKSKKEATLSVSTRLYPHEIEYIESFGSRTTGLHYVINYCLERGVELYGENPEIELFNLIILPAIDDGDLRRWYTETLRLYVHGGETDSIIEYFVKIGLHSQGIWSALQARGFVTKPLTTADNPYGAPVARPTIRVRDGVPDNLFQTIYNKYRDFLLLEGTYKDRL